MPLVKSELQSWLGKRFCDGVGGEPATQTKFRDISCGGGGGEGTASNTTTSARTVGYLH
jgi:hypothetical protein